MKGLSAITLAVAVTMSATAFAAPKNSTKKTSVASTSSISGAATTSPALTSPTAVGASAGSIGATLPTTAPKNWSIDLYTENYYGVRAANTNGGGEIENFSFVGINYKLSDKYKAYVRPSFSGVIGADSETDSKMQIADTEVGLRISKIAQWKNGGINLSNRLYLPTSKASQEAGQVARLRENLVINQEIGKNFEIGHLTDPRFAFHTQNEYRNAKGELVQTKDIALVQYAYATAKANDKLSATLALGTIDSWERSDRTQTSKGYLDISASAQLTKEIGLTLGVDSEPNIGHKQDKRFTFMRDTDTQYYMNVMASM